MLKSACYLCKEGMQKKNELLDKTHRFYKIPDNVFLHHCKSFQPGIERSSLPISENCENNKFNVGNNNS